MNLSQALTRIPTPIFCSNTRKLAPNIKCVHHHFKFNSPSVKFPMFLSSTSAAHNIHLPLIVHSSSVPAIASDVTSASTMSHDPKQGNMEKLEVIIEKVIYGCRFFAILAVGGSLIGSFLCFFKGCTYVFSSYRYYFQERVKVIGTLVEATDVYLLGTVMLVFGMGLYELFISNLDKAKYAPIGKTPYQSNLFGLFALKERPQWLEIKTVNELKTKLGHVIVMLLLIGLFDKSKKAVIQSPIDLLCFSASVLLSSGCLFLLSRLKD